MRTRSRGHGRLVDAGELTAASAPVDVRVDPLERTKRPPLAFESNALAAGVTVFELARVMGTSVAMIERHYGTLIGGAHAGIAGRLDALEAYLAAAEDALAR